jgi:hypothetical protein
MIFMLQDGYIFVHTKSDLWLGTYSGQVEWVERSATQQQVAREKQRLSTSTNAPPTALIEISDIKGDLS